MGHGVGLREGALPPSERNTMIRSMLWRCGLSTLMICWIFQTQLHAAGSDSPGVALLADSEGHKRVARSHRLVEIHNADSSATLVLRQFRVFAPDAKIVVHDPEGDRTLPSPRNRYFKGHVDGSPGSMVVVSVLESGEIRGISHDKGRYSILGGTENSKSSRWSLRSREVDPNSELGHRVAGFSCGTDDLGKVPTELLSALNPDMNVRETTTKSANYTARLAIETDEEFLAKFNGNETAATNYVADIIAFGSALYSLEANTSWLLQYLSLWSQTDPWAQSNPGCGLYEFGRYWNDNRQSEVRTTAAFFSGKGTNAGVAWVGALCYGEFDINIGTSCSGLSPAIDNYGGAYAYIGGMDGNFDINNPGVLWDIVAVTHELGHNFNSPHTHCYANLGGNSDPIDECYAGQCGDTGCHCGATSFPSGCPGGGNGCGTIMSYCHTLSPGLSNISLTLGLNHPYGVEPSRVPSRMLSHVSSREASTTGCLEYESAGSIFGDDFESNNTDAWSTTVP